MKNGPEPSRVPHDYNPVEHGHLYGSGRNGKLMAGYMGHYLCFPYFGGPSSEFESQLGYQTHGEAYNVKYDIEEIFSNDSKAVAAVSASLPLTSYNINRRFTLLPGQSVVMVEEEIEKLNK